MSPLFFCFFSQFPLFPPPPPPSLDGPNAASARMAATVGHASGSPGTPSRIPRLAQRSPSAQPRLGDSSRSAASSVDHILATAYHVDTDIATRLTNEGPMYTYSALPRTPPMRGDATSPLRYSRNESDADGLHQTGDFAQSTQDALFRAPARGSGATRRGDSRMLDNGTSFDSRLRELRSELGCRRRNTAHRRSGIVVADADEDGTGEAAAAEPPGDTMAAGGAAAHAGNHSPRTSRGGDAHDGSTNGDHDNNNDDDDDDDDDDDSAGRWMAAMALGAVSPAEANALAAAVAAVANKRGDEPFQLPTMPEESAARQAGVITGDSFKLPTMPKEEETEDQEPVPRPFDLGNFQMADAAFLESEAWRNVSSSEGSSRAASPGAGAGTGGSIHGVPISVLLKNEAEAQEAAAPRGPKTTLSRGAAAAAERRVGSLNSASSSSMYVALVHRRAANVARPM